MFSRKSAAFTRATTTAALFSRWIHGKSVHTQKAYDCDVRDFTAYMVQIPFEQVTLNDLDLRQVRLDDLQDWSDAMEQRGLSPKTRSRRLGTLKAFLSFAHRVGYLEMNVGVAVEAPKVEDRLADRILSEMQVMTMIALEPGRREQLLIKFLYYSACRAGEVALLRWKDILPNRDGGQVMVWGKGSKTRVVKLPASLYRELMEFKQERGASASDPVFPSRKKNGCLKHDRIRGIVQAAGERIGVFGVTPHWLRHCHASHALERNAPLPLVRDTLGHSPNANTTNKYLHAKPNDSSGLYLPS